MAATFGILLSVTIFFTTPLAWAQQDFFQDDDIRWSLFLKGRCALIEKVPIVAKAANVSMTAATLSSVVGYYERQVPILGPPVPRRIPKLVENTRAAYKELDMAAFDAVAKALYTVEARSFRNYIVSARQHLNETEGAIRSYILQKYVNELGPAEIGEILRKLAGDKLQAVTVENILRPSAEAIKSFINKEKTAVLSIDSGKYVYAVVGYVEEGQTLIVIDPQSAKPVAVPAEQVFITDADRKSAGEFSRRAREILQDRKILIDEATSCAAKRPNGVRFLNPFKVAGQIQLYVIHDWTLDKGQVKELLRKR